MALTSAWLSSPIESASDADALLSTLGRGLYAIAGLQGVLGAFLAWRSGSIAFLGDAAFWLMAGFLLPRTRSRALSVVVLVAALGAAAVTFAARFGNATGGKNIVLALLLVAVGVRSVIATVKYHRFRESRVWWRNVAIVAALYVAGAVAVFVAALILYAIANAAGIDWSEDGLGASLLVATGLMTLVIYVASRRWLPLLVPPAETA